MINHCQADRQRCRARIVFVVIAPLYAMFGAYADAEDALPSMESIRKVWIERQNLAQSVRVQWKQRVFYSAGSLDVLRNSQNQLSSHPEKDSTVEFTPALLLDGLQMRYDGKMVGAGKEPRLLDYTWVSNDTYHASLVTHGPKELRGLILRSRHDTDAISAPLVPLLGFLRPVSPTVPPDDEKLVVDQIDTLNGDLRCIVVKDGLNRFWLDPARGFVIVKWQSFNQQSVVVIQADIVYKRHSNLGWIPASWKVDWLRGGKTIDNSNEVCDVTIECDVNAEDDPFRIQFPSGARVYNQRTGEQYVVPASQATD